MRGAMPAGSILRRIVIASLALASSIAAAQPIVIAHRGNDGTAPENTIAAFRRAIDRGTKLVETDVRMSRDGELVLMHDRTVDRTTDGSGLVDRLTMTELKRLDAGSHSGPDYAGETVPTLRDALRLVRRTQTSFLLDMKPGTPPETVLGLVRSEQAEGSVVFGLRDPAQARALRQLAPDARIVALLRTFDDLDEFEGAGVRIMRLWSDWIDPVQGGNPKLVADVKARGHSVWCVVGKARPKSESEWKATHARLLATGIDAITTDRPDLVVSALP